MIEIAVHTELTEIQLDALKEIANIGSGHAATALSQLLGGRSIGMDVPTAGLVELEEVASRLGGADASVVTVSLSMLSGARGHLQLAFPEDAARAVAGLLLGVSQVEGSLVREAQSAIMEAANILASAYLNAIGRAVGLTLLPSVPRLSTGVAAELLLEPLERLQASPGQTLLLQTRFFDRSPGGSAPLRFYFGQFLVVPDPPSLPKLLAALRLRAG